MQLAESERVLSQLQKIEPGLLGDPRIVEVLDLFAAYQSGDFGTFFQFYRRCDFLSAVCLAPLVLILATSDIFFATPNTFILIHSESDLML